MAKDPRMHSVLAQLDRDQRMQSRFMQDQMEALDRVQQRLDRMGARNESGT